MQSILLDEANFRYIRETGSVYVDKTKLIYEHFAGPRSDYYHLLVRPRRFGKSLLCSTIKALFEGDGRPFEGLYIGDKWDFAEEKRPVIHLDLSDLGETAEEMEKRLETMLRSFAETEGVTLSQDETDPTSLLKDLVHHLKRTHKTNVAVIIDEFDAPFMKLVNNPVERKKIHSTLIEFYAILKGLEDELRLVFLTGIMPIRLNTIFYGLNNIQDHSCMPELNTICGYTELELDKYFGRHLEALSESLKHGNVNETKQVLRDQFGGYRFGYDPSRELTNVERVFNPFAMNYVMKDQHLYDQWPKSDNPFALVERIVKVGKLDVALGSSEIPEWCVDRTIDSNMFPLENLMFHTGYLTFQQYDPKKEMMTLAPPNKCVSKQLLDCIIELLRGEWSSGSDSLLAQQIAATIFSSELSLQVMAEALFASITSFVRGNRCRRSLKAADGKPSNKALDFATIASLPILGSCRRHNLRSSGVESGFECDMRSEDGTAHCFIQFKMDKSVDAAMAQMLADNRRSQHAANKRAVLLAINVTETKAQAQAEVQIKVGVLQPGETTTSDFGVCLTEPRSAI